MTANTEPDWPFTIPAIFADKFQARVRADVTRLSFGEASTPDGEPHARVSIVMPTGHAIALAKLLTDLAAQLQSQIGAMQAAPPGSGRVN